MLNDLNRLFYKSKAHHVTSALYLAKEFEKNVDSVKMMIEG